MNDMTRVDKSTLYSADGMLDSIRQWFFPAEFRISSPRPSRNIAPLQQDGATSPGIEAEHQVSGTDGKGSSEQLIAEIATCLWYLKTKHFRRAWEEDGIDDIGGDDTPRVRRAISRLNRAIDALSESGIEIQDPTNQRYPPGGEGMMCPLQFQPTAGLAFEKVSETISPIVYRDSHLIQRGEVFVTVPKEDVNLGSQPTVPVEGDREHGDDKPVQIDDRILANETNASDSADKEHNSKDITTG